MALADTILDKMVVKKENTKEEIYLGIYLKLGQNMRRFICLRSYLWRGIDVRGNCMWRALPHILSSYYDCYGIISYITIRIVFRNGRSLIHKHVDLLKEQ